MVNHHHNHNVHVCLTYMKELLIRDFLEINKKRGTRTTGKHAPKICVQFLHAQSSYKLVSIFICSVPLSHHRGIVSSNKPNQIFISSFFEGKEQEWSCWSGVILHTTSVGQTQREKTHLFVIFTLLYFLFITIWFIGTFFT